MRIAMVCPLFECVPPVRYGGTERVVEALVDELVRQGHEVTLFAAEGSACGGVELVPGCRPLRTENRMEEAEWEHARQLRRVVQRRLDFDLVHFHTELTHLPLLDRLGVPHVTTMHGRVDDPQTSSALLAAPAARLVAISRSQAASCPGAPWVDVVHHGLPLTRYREGPGGDALVFVGRTSPEKGLDRAIRIARRAGLALHVAAKRPADDEAWFETRVRPLLGDDVTFLGEVTDAHKQELYGRARALLFPISWREPFGLVMIEALACGTPVIAWPCGAVPEVLDDGVSGLLVESEEAAAEACHRVAALERQACRRAFVERFSAARMASDYVRLYERLIGARCDAARPGGTT